MCRHAGHYPLPLARRAAHPEVRERAFLLALASFLYVRVAIAAAPITLTCPDAGGTQIFLLDLDNANVVSATGRQRDSGTTEFLFKNTPIHTTEAVLTWQWVKEGSIRTYVLNRNTLELTITDRAKAGWVLGPPGKLGREATFQLQCILSRRQL